MGQIPTKPQKVLASLIKNKFSDYSDWETDNEEESPIHRSKMRPISAASPPPKGTSLLPAAIPEEETTATPSPVADQMDKLEENKAVLTNGTVNNEVKS